MKFRIILGAVAGLLVAATASADIVLPGYAGLPDPIADGDLWIQSGSRLQFSDANDTSWHDYTIIVPVKSALFAQTLTITWQHGITGSLVAGAAQVRMFAFHPDGTQSDITTFNPNLGFPLPQAQLSIPAGGTAILQVHMKSDTNGNNHYISRIVTSNNASL